MKGSCKSLVELEYFLEEVCKATTDQLDWNNPEGLQYPHDMPKPLPLIPNSRGRRVIPFDHFINNDLAYLSGGILSRTYATLMTKTKAADYGHIKWIEDLGRKRQQFYGYAANMESAHDVYSRNIIIGINMLTIVEWHNYKHLEWITVRRDDDKLYTFKEGDYNRLRLQDIEDMLLLLVQGKLTNINIEECLALGVSLRMFTRSIVLRRRMEDLQLGVESNQKKLNLTRPDTYRSDLKQKSSYTAYSNPKGFIYHNKDKKNRLMRIDELHKFSNGAMIQAIDRQLRNISIKVKEFQRSFCHSDTVRLSRSDEVLKLKNFKKDAALKFFKVDKSRKLPVETLDNPFVAPVNIETIEAFMNKVFNRCLTPRTSGHDQTNINILQLFHAMINRTNIDYAALLWQNFMNNVRQKKEAIQYPRFIKLIIADLMKKFLEIPKRIEEDYHSIKDEIPLVSVYTTGDVRVRGMLILDAFLTEEIRATNNFKEYETVFMKRDEIAKATLLSLTLHKTALAAEAQENIAKVQEKLAEEEIEKLVEGDEDKESYASEFVDSVLNDDVNDFDTRLEPKSHKENPKKVDDDDVEIEEEKKDDIETEKEKKDDVEIEKEKNDEEIENEKNNDNIEETDKVIKEKDIVDDVMGSTKIRKEQKQTPIPLPTTRSPRNVSSSDKIVSEELTAIASPTTATTSKASSTTKHKKQSISFRSKTLPGSIAGMCRRRGLIRFHIKNKFVTHDFFMSDKIAQELTTFHKSPAMNLKPSFEVKE
ncbi:hypothetical protein Tco_1082739 [Tanacetum coccineum]|uniref:Uncharacterized protein n=1 Tax=Tanacetum coccineum TaxID=301880 RepID=A0ABQ5I1D2_9ASTR